MPVSREDVKRALDPEEPNYERAAKLGADALPYLEEFIHGSDESLASKAAYLTGVISDPHVPQILARAAGSSSDVVRIAVASTTSHLPSREASPILARLTEDPSYGVRKMVLRSTPASPSAELLAKLADMARNDADRVLRNRAGLLIARVRSP